ncbi:hypothetical protein [Nocardia sp. NPDC050435]|uniref:hypothetical protein n=1 Tax=Nocardia sp. NPDC050435 TaxID=3155040 RepID=UPI0033E29F4C
MSEINTDTYLVSVTKAAEKAAKALKHMGDCLEDTRESLSTQPEYVDLERIVVLDTIAHGELAAAFLALSEAVSSAVLGRHDRAELLEIIKEHMSPVRFEPVSVRAAGVDPAEVFAKMEEHGRHAMEAYNQRLAGSEG